MKNIDEDYAHGVRQQAIIDSEDASATPQWHQKIGTTIPFSKTADRDQWPRIPLSVPVPYVKVGKKEALFWVVLVGLWLGYLFFGAGS